MSAPSERPPLPPGAIPPSTYEPEGDVVTQPKCGTRTLVIGAAWKARRDAGLPCWCGEPIHHVGWPVCVDRATPAGGPS